MISEKTEVIKQFISKNLSKKRYIHSVNVAEEAVRLSKKYKLDPEKAYYCGIAHDIAKELAQKEQKILVCQSKLCVSEVEISSPPLWHAIAGAELLIKHFNVNDEDILNAVRYHTVARAGMTGLEMIVYLADLISADRHYKDVDVMRKFCNKSLEMGMLEALKFSITDCVLKGNTIPCSTFEAYNYYLNK